MLPADLTAGRSKQLQLEHLQNEGSRQLNLTSLYSDSALLR